MSQEILTAIVASAVAIIGAVTSFILSYLKSKSIQNELSTIKEALGRSDKLYYIICPSCKTKIYLSRVSIEEDYKEDARK